MRGNAFIISLFAFLFFAANSFAQLQVTANNNPTTLAQTLAGSGVTISNAVMNCPSAANDATGTFVGTASNIGIAQGVLLTSGSVNNAVGPNIQSSITTVNNVTFNDPDLMAIDPNAIYDVCIVEFDAKPSCDTLGFTFAFGSDEYPEFVGSSYNDAFGIFVTGSNPIGPPYNGFNMTMIPNTTSPVSINNVNNGTVCPTTGPCMNCNYYIDNCGGATIEYDGFTSVITKTLQTVPYQPYQFKFAIADAGDHAFDSGVFFGLGSFSCLGGVGVPETSAGGVTAVLYPNPIMQTSTLTLEGPGPVIAETFLRIVNMFGQEVQNLHSVSGKFLIDRNGLASGIYFYLVEYGKEPIARGKLVAE